MTQPKPLECLEMFHCGDAKENGFPYSTGGPFWGKQEYRIGVNSTACIYVDESPPHMELIYTNMVLPDWCDIFRLQLRYLPSDIEYSIVLPSANDLKRDGVFIVKLMPIVKDVANGTR